MRDYSNLSDAEVNAKRLAAVRELVEKIYERVEAHNYADEIEALAAVWPEAVEE